MKDKSLKCFSLYLGFALFLFGIQTEANMPVFDWSNWFQNSTLILNQGEQLKNQIDQYNNQLQQYDTMLNNTKSLTSYQWDDTNSIINNLINTTNTLDYYKQQAGSLDAYLNQYQSEAYYSQSLCRNGRCSKEELAQLRTYQKNASEAQKHANDAMLRGIDKQQQTLKTDAEKLRQLQQQAQNAEGQKQAIQAASQLASAQTNQLFQIRGLLIAQQNAEATRAATVANKEAIQAVGDEQFRTGTFHKSSGKTW